MACKEIGNVPVYWGFERVGWCGGCHSGLSVSWAWAVLRAKEVNLLFLFVNFCTYLWFCAIFGCPEIAQKYLFVQHFALKGGVMMKEITDKFLYITMAGRGLFFLKRGAVEYGAGQRHLVGVFQFPSYGNASGNDAHLDVKV